MEFGTDNHVPHRMNLAWLVKGFLHVINVIHSYQRIYPFGDFSFGSLLAVVLLPLTPLVLG